MILNQSTTRGKNTTTTTATAITTKEWSSEQRAGLAYELKELERRGLKVEWHNQRDANNTRVEWKLKASSGKSYTLQLRLPSSFPYGRRQLLVVSPRLRDDVYRASHSECTLSPIDGYPQIGLYDLEDDGSTIFVQLMHGREWIEAYEQIKQYETIGDYLEWD